MKIYFLAAILVASLSIVTAGCDKTEPPAAPNSNGSTTKPDNTAMNKADRGGATTTPLDQGENSSDIKITAAIRRSVMADNGLSTNAHNAKIVSDKGVVTLRGVVNSSAEKDSVESKAKAVEGVVSVDDQLEVKTP